jgi:hypothetical protein
LIIFVALSLSFLDIIRFGRRFFNFIRFRDKFNIKSFWRVVFLGREQLPHGSGPEYAGLVVDEPEDYEHQELKVPEDIEPNLHRDQEFRRDDIQTVQWADLSQNNPHKHSLSASSDGTLLAGITARPFSRNSDDTLHDAIHDHYDPPKASLFRRILKIAHAVVERVVVFAGFMQLLTGIVTYTGGCRGYYLNGCLAHLISASASYHSFSLLTSSRLQRAVSSGAMAYLRSLAFLVLFLNMAGRGIGHLLGTIQLPSLSNVQLSSFMGFPTRGWRGLGPIRTTGILPSSCSTLVLP